MQQLVADLDHGAHLVGGKGRLTEGRICLRDLLALIDPAGFSAVLRDRDLTGTGRGADYRRKATEDVVLLQRLDELSLKLIRYGIAALLILADGKSLQRLIGNAPAQHVPEGFAVLRRCRRTDVFLLAILRIGMHRRGGRSCEFRIHLRLLLKAGNLITERLHIGSHPVILLHGIRFHEAVCIPVLFQKCLRLFPQGVSLVSKLKYLTHGFYLSFRMNA